MLITTCSHCQARFRVTPQQLNARQGQVRCGRCSQVFNGFQILERFPDDDTGGRLIAEHEARRIAEEAPAEPLAPGATVDLPLFDEEPAATVPEPAPATAPPATPPRRTRRLGLDLTLEVEPPPPPPRAWRFAAAFLALVLLLELAYVYRGPIAQRYPVLRPAMESVCARLACSVPWSREEALIKLEDSELLEVPGKPNEIALGARIRNLASVAQEYPHLELSLTDLTGQAALRRVLRPTDYLGRPLAHGEVMAPGGEIALQLRLETPRLKATGYALLVFYP
jgi:predicted Zn finger-like uncharacterized protein